jgi:hypothetical protein
MNHRTMRIKKVCAAEFTWSHNGKVNTCASLKPTHKSRDEMKFTFDVAKCEKNLMSYLSRVKLKCLTLYHLLIN